MVKGEATQTKIHYKGTNTDEDFIIFVDDAETMKKWKEDKSIPMAHFISTFKIFVTHKYVCSLPSPSPLQPAAAAGSSRSSS